MDDKVKRDANQTERIRDVPNFIAYRGMNRNPNDTENDAQTYNEID